MRWWNLHIANDICCQVRNLAALVNADERFRVKGWFKPAVVDTGVTQELFWIHVPYLAPNGPLTPTQRDAMYKDGEKFSVLFTPGKTKPDEHSKHSPRIICSLFRNGFWQQASAYIEVAKRDCQRVLTQKSKNLMSSSWKRSSESWLHFICWICQLILPGNILPVEVALKFGRSTHWLNEPSFKNLRLKPFFLVHHWISFLLQLQHYH